MLNSKYSLNSFKPQQPSVLMVSRILVSSSFCLWPHLSPPKFYGQFPWHSCNILRKKPVLLWIKPACVWPYLCIEAAGRAIPSMNHPTLFAGQRLLAKLYDAKLTMPPVMVRILPMLLAFKCDAVAGCIPLPENQHVSRTAMISSMLHPRTSWNSPWCRMQ